MIEELVNSFFDSVQDVPKRQQIAHIIKNSMADLMDDQREDLRSRLINDSIKMIESGSVDIYTEVWLYTFLLNISDNKDIVLRFINRMKNSEGMAWQQKIFAFWQIHNHLFAHPEVCDDETLICNWGYLERLYGAIKNDFSLPKIEVNADDLNEDFAVVIIEQYLTEEHGPTKTILDRCAVLQGVLKKKVLLINTAECLTEVGAFPYFYYFVGSYFEGLLDKESVEWKGETIPFYQCNNNMPDFLELRQLLDMILKLKPATVILVGGPSILAALVNEYIPVFSVGLTQSGIVPSMASFMAVEDRLLEKCGDIVEKMGRDRSCLIPGRFTFSLKPQTENHSREEFGIDEDEYVIAVIGTRLTDEITDSFMDMFDHIVFEKMRILVMGFCTRIDEIMERYPKVAKSIKYLGPCKDILSMLDICDIYVNPNRRGGATSAVEAMFKGKPVVTIDFGDVGGVVDEEFKYPSYYEMEKAIIDLYNDKDLYEKQSIHAKELADINMDSTTEFKKMLDIYNERKYSKFKA